MLRQHERNRERKKGEDQSKVEHVDEAASGKEKEKRKMFWPSVRRRFMLLGRIIYRSLKLVAIVVDH